jgi:hypothetical protein
VSDGIADWQRRFSKQPCVWGVRVAGEETGNYYDCEGGALLEVEWRRRRGEAGARVTCIRLHSLQLSQERWVSPARPTPDGGKP